MRVAGHIVAVAVLTVTTQIGGLAWLAALALARGRSVAAFLAVFLLLYTASSAGARIAAPAFGRVAVPCWGDGARALPVFCALNRTYVVPELRDHLEAVAAATGGVTVLDAGFPFLDEMPLLPHLSHDDGRKADLALRYEGGALRSPIGYFAFEQPRPGDPQPCTEGGLMRWGLDWLQPVFPNRPLDEPGTARVLRWLSANAPPGGKIFVEPHLAARLGVSAPAIRFQGCNAARHDDHIHIQI